MKKIKRVGHGLGKGHGSITTLPPIEPIVITPQIKQEMQVTGLEDASMLFNMGECTIISSVSHLGWHLSISTPYRYPTWDEVANAR